MSTLPSKKRALDDPLIKEAYRLLMLAQGDPDLTDTRTWIIHCDTWLSSAEDGAAPETCESPTQFDGDCRGNCGHCQQSVWAHICPQPNTLKANDQLYRLRPLCTCQGTAHESASSSGYTPNPTCPVHQQA